MDKDLTMKIPGEVVRRAVKDKVLTAIAAELGGPEEVIQAVVEKALSMKVDKHGKQSKYDSENKYNMIEVLCEQAIRDFTELTIKKFFKSNQESLERALKKAIIRHANATASTIVQAIHTSIESSFLVNFSINFTPKRY